MAENGNETGAPPAPQQSSEEQQSVVDRVVNLPLLSSAYGMMSAAYSNTKESHPYLRSMCSAAEMGVKTLGAAAATGSKPFLDKLEPQIATANEYACMGLNKLEEKLPILQQPTEKVVADTRELVSGARDSVTHTVFGARDSVTSSVAGMVDMAKGVVWGGVEMTKAAVSGGVNTVMGSRVGQMVSSGMELALSKSEEWAEHYLPMTQEELAQTTGSELAPSAGPGSRQSYFVRLGSLSSRVQSRALQHSLGKVQRARQSTVEALGELHATIDLIESAKQRLGEAPEKLHRKWVEWREKQPGDQEETTPRPELEPRTLAMLRSLTLQLRSACGGVVSSVQGLPQHVQEQLAEARRAAEQIQSSLGTAGSFGELSAPLLAQSRQQLAQVRQSFDVVVEYLLNNTPLNWLVGPFAPQLVEKSEGETPVREEKGSLQP
ncbi:mannose-6-phosphate receptor binding protein 1 isoform X2 [Polyodon spathula]|uniref:mannose-6-phosphate receptor binding protein 1 isoform X2 n=1 Tax=Polyodon spathula TaxID=7913 RepID=UPI001B7E6877|nr:mannose-6-phosphate receptor binding protein 1 isoform X2 [Polyodon spathula]